MNSRYTINMMLQLQKLAIQIFSQINFSFYYKRNESIFERMHTKKRGIDLSINNSYTSITI